MSSTNLVVLVCGGREFGEAERFGRPLKPVAEADREVRFVFETLSRVHTERGIRLLIHGACLWRSSIDLRGADRRGQEWAVLHEIPYLGVPARWRALGKRAGMTRNAEMLDLATQLGVRPDVVIGFPGGVGTAGMVSLAAGRGIATWRPHFSAA